jgi:hypothetical protein
MDERFDLNIVNVKLGEAITRCLQNADDATRKKVEEIAETQPPDPDDKDLHVGWIAKTLTFPRLGRVRWAPLDVPPLGQSLRFRHYRHRRVVQTPPHQSKPAPQIRPSAHPNVQPFVRRREDANQASEITNSSGYLSAMCYGLGGATPMPTHTHAGASG